MSFSHLAAFWSWLIYVLQKVRKTLVLIFSKSYYFKSPCNINSLKITKELKIINSNDIVRAKLCLNIDNG